MEMINRLLHSQQVTMRGVDKTAMRADKEKVCYTLIEPLERV